MQNILGIVDTSGNLVVRYNYDAYGNFISYSGSNIYIIQLDIKDTTLMKK